MGKKKWVIKLEDGEHNIELEHSYLSGKRIISVDDDIIEHIRYNLYDIGSKHEFEINGHSCIILITAGIKFSYDLFVDGVGVETGLPIDLDRISRTIKYHRNLLPHSLSVCVAGFSYGFLLRYGKPIPVVLLLAVLIYLTVYFGSKALIRKIKKERK